MKEDQLESKTDLLTRAFETCAIYDQFKSSDQMLGGNKHRRFDKPREAKRFGNDSESTRGL